MKRYTIIHLLIISIMFMNSCVHVELQNMTEKQKLSVKVNNDDIHPSRAITNTYLSSGATIGVTVLDDVTLSEYEGEAYNNVKYTASGSGTSQTWTPATELLLTNNTAKAIAYYPYSSTATDYTAIPVYAGYTDWMYSGWEEGLYHLNNEVHFKMKHALAALEFTFKKQNYEGTANLTNLQIKSDGLGTSAKMNAEDGTLSNFINLNNFYSLAYNTNLTENGYKLTVQMIPDGNGKSIEIKCTIDGNIYSKHILLDDYIKQGDMIKATFILTQTNLELQEVTVTPWVVDELEETGMNSYYTHLGLIYNVTSTTTTTPLFAGSLSTISEMLIDGVKVTPVASYKFSTTGRHEVKIKFKDETAIPDNAFKNNNNLVNVLHFPTLLQNIGSAAFYRCEGLTSIPNFPNNLKTIGSSAFYKCTSMTAKITIPDACTNIYQNAFEDCSGIRELNIGSGLKDIGYDAFWGCNNIEFIHVDENNTVYDSRENCNAIIITQSDKLIKASTNTFIPEGVKIIGNDAFMNCKGLAGTLIIPNSVTEIEDCIYNSNNKRFRAAFYGCSGITGLKIGTGLKKIGKATFYACTRITGTLEIPANIEFIEGFSYSDYYKGAFQGCAGITELKLNEGLKEIGGYTFNGCGNITSIDIPNSCKLIGTSAFSYCTGLTSINLGAGVQTIEGNAFYNCKAIEGELTIPESVTSIGSSAFYNCTGITGTLTIPNSVTVIGSSAFYNCTGLTGTLTISGSCENIGFNAFQGCSNISGLELKEGIKTIGDGVFYGCNNLTGKIVLPESLITIKDKNTSSGSSYGTFQGCTGITEIEFNNNLEIIGNYAFYGCTGLTGTLTIPGSCKSIGTAAFSGCIKLSGHITLPGNLETIGNAAFYNCEKITGEIILPNAIKTIGANTFYGCRGITQLKLNEGLQSIGYGAFYGCSGITGEIVFPESLTIIENGDLNSNKGAFAGCTGITGITFKDGITSIGTAAFSSCTGITGTLIIPSSVTTIGRETFGWCSKINELILNEGLESIGGGAFGYCTGLTGTLDLPNSLIEIGGATTGYNGAFRDCTGLTGKLTIPGSCTIIASHAFRGCSNISELELEEGVESLYESAFESCRGLTKITIPNSVTSIGKYAFQSCTGLTEITSLAITAPSITNYTFQNVRTNGTLTVPTGATGYNTWMGTGNYYLGKYNWTIQEFTE